MNACTLRLLSLLMLCVLAPGRALAQDPAPAAQETATPEAQTEPDPLRIEEIVVTAQRREQKLEDVPIAVTALSADQIESRGIESLADLNALAPGLQISKTPSNSTISQITIRGVSQINPAIYWDPAVGIYLDGVYIGKSQGSIFDVVDLAAVEVLRGPQGTLYGRNTIGGTINLRSRRPSGEFGGSASVELGNYNAMVSKVSVDLPKWGIASISIGARTERRDGWIEVSRNSPVNDFNDRHNDGLRLAALLEFSENWEGVYSFDRSNVDQTNNFDQLFRADLPFLAPFASRDRQKDADVDAPSFEFTRIQGHAFTLNFKLDDQHSVKSISGYRRLEWNDSLDLDGSPLPVAFTQRYTDYDQLSQDLQLTGAWDRVNYVAGAYYFTDDGETDNPQTFFELAAPDGDVYFDSRYGTETRAWALYGQLDYRPLDPLTLTAGLRYTREKKELDRVFGLRGDTADPFFYLIPEGTHASKTFDDTTPLFSAAWRFTDDLNVYARYAEGFKSGGFNGEFSRPPNPADPNDLPFEQIIALNLSETTTPFKPEKQESIELGLKSGFLDGRASLNLALFHNEVKDLQASIFLGSGAAASAIRNAGEATIKGAEVEAAIVLLPGTQLRFNYAYLDAEYDEFIDGGEDQANNRAFVHAPEHTCNVVLDSRFAKLAGGELRGTVDFAWTDDFFTYPYQLSGPGEAGFNPGAQVARNTQVDAHGILNLRLALTEIALGASAIGELALWSRNLTDEDTASNYIDFGPGFGNLTVANFVEPRTFGITGIVRW